MENSQKDNIIKPTKSKKEPKAPEWLFANIAEASKNARKIYFLYIGFLFYCAFTIFGTPDRDIILNEKIKMPILNIDVPLIGFMLMAPLVAIFLFVYLQMYLGRLKWLIDLSTNYAPIEKGRLYPWMLNFPKDPERGFSKGLQEIIIKFSLWGLLPIVLGLFAVQSLRTHNSLICYFVGVTPIIGATSVLIFWYRYERVQRKVLKFIKKNLGKVLLTLLMFLFEIMLLFSGIPMAKRGELFTLDLSNEKLTTEPTVDYEGIYWAHFAGIHLEGANLTSTILERANLTFAHLQGATMDEAILMGANLEGADLREADLIGAKLYGAKLYGAKLYGANLFNADLREAYLYGANLRGANLREADLTDADLSEAILSEADLWRANLEGANLSEADLIEANLIGAILIGANLSYADLRGAKNLSVIMLNNARNRALAFYDEDILTELGLPLDHNDRVSQRNFSEYNFSGANLSGADLWRANLEGANLSEADLSEAILIRADLWRANLEGADLSEAELIGADLRGANLIGANLSYADLRGAKNLTIEQFYKIKTLYNTKLEPSLRKQIEEKYPHLLEEPEWLKEEEKEKD